MQTLTYDVAVKEDHRINLNVYLPEGIMPQNAKVIVVFDEKPRRRIDPRELRGFAKGIDPTIERIEERL